MTELFSSPPRAATTASIYQVRRALLDAGLLAAADAAAADVIAALPEPDRSRADLSWKVKTVISRDGRLLNAVAAHMGLTDAEIDNLFAAAAAIEA